MTIKYDEIEATNRYKLMSSCVVPRPIAWISTLNEDGSINLAPFSYFTPLSSNPPIIIVSIGHKIDGMPKDTLANIRRSGKCTINLTSPNQLDSMNFSSKALDSGVSEAEVFDIDMELVEDGYPPIVKGANSAFFCSLYQELKIDGSKTVPIILKIEAQYIDDKNIIDRENFKVDCKNVGRVGAEYIIYDETIQASRIPDDKKR